MTTSFTPGPWHTGPHYTSDVESREGRICSCDPFMSPRAEANVRLIAAAPDLLAACKRALEADGELRGTARRGMLRDAVARAEGL